MKSDRWIVAKIKDRDERGIHEIIDKYGGLLFSIIAKYSVGYGDFHEECFNDVLLAIWENIDQFDIGRGSFKSWIGGGSPATRPLTC